MDPAKQAAVLRMLSSSEGDKQQQQNQQKPAISPDGAQGLSMLNSRIGAFLQQARTGPAPVAMDIEIEEDEFEADQNDDDDDGDDGQDGAFRAAAGMDPIMALLAARTGAKLASKKSKAKPVSEVGANDGDDRGSTSSSDIDVLEFDSSDDDDDNNENQQDDDQQQQQVPHEIHMNIIAGVLQAEQADGTSNKNGDVVIPTETELRKQAKRQRQEQQRMMMLVRALAGGAPVNADNDGNTHSNNNNSASAAGN